MKRFRDLFARRSHAPAAPTPTLTIDEPTMPPPDTTASRMVGVRDFLSRPWKTSSYFVFEREDGARFPSDVIHCFAAMALAVTRGGWRPASSGDYLPARGQLIAADDARELARGIRKGLEAMAAVEPSEWHHVEADIMDQPHIIPDTGDPRPIPRFVRGHRPFTYLEETLFGRPYAEQLAAFLEGGSVRLAPPTGMVPSF